AAADEPIIVEFLSTCGLTSNVFQTFTKENYALAQALGIVEIPYKILDRMINVYISAIDSYSIPDITNYTCHSAYSRQVCFVTCSILQYAFEKQNIKGFANYDDFYHNYIRPRMHSHVK